MDEDERIRRRAHQIWNDEGQPEGRSDLHWQMARQLVAIEDAPEAGLKPNPLGTGEGVGEPVEEAALMDNLGEFPTLTDQGEEQTTPRAKPAKKAAAKAPTKRQK